MKRIQIFNAIISLYITVLILLLLSIMALPLAIHSDWSITQAFILKEEIIETFLIAALFGMSFFILRRFKHTVTVYEYKFRCIDKEKSKLLSRLKDAFRYIGTVNVELQEIHSILQKLDNYPRTKKEFKMYVNYLTAKAMTIAKSPWVAIRMIDKKSNRTVFEHTVVRPGYELPAGIIGNRDILDKKSISGIVQIVNSKKNVDLITVCLFSDVECTENENILIRLLINQIEMYFLLYHADFSHVQQSVLKKEGIPPLHQNLF